LLTTTETGAMSPMPGVQRLPVLSPMHPCGDGSCVSAPVFGLRASAATAWPSISAT
jgi:hypothetical protein